MVDWKRRYEQVMSDMRTCHRYLETAAQSAALAGERHLKDGKRKEYDESMWRQNAYQTSAQMVRHVIDSNA